MRLGDEEYKGFIDLLMDIDFYDLVAWIVTGKQPVSSNGTSSSAP